MKLTLTLWRQKAYVGVWNVVSWHMEKPCSSVNIIHNPSNNSKCLDLGGASHCFDSSEFSLSWRFFEVIETVRNRL
jgi:hypothetical protein